MKKIFSVYNLCFIGIFILGIFLRFYALGNIPGSLNWDEVSWGYNAYSIAQTGKDEHGVSFPLSFEAFGDYKQPMYVYLDALSVKLFGLTPFAVRFPSALLGALCILSVYVLVRTVFYSLSRVRLFSLIVMFLFAISPWSVQFSRVAYEANVASFFVITGVGLLFLGYIKKTIWLMSTGAFVMALGGYTYHSAKLFTPLLLVGLLVYARYFFGLSFKKITIILLVFLIASSVWIVDSRTTARGRSVLFTSNQTELLKDSIEKLNSDKERNDFLGSLTHNRRFVYATVFFQNYLSHYEPNFLFIGNDNPRHHAPGMGVEYLVLLPVILYGIVQFIKQKVRSSLVIFYWFITAPIAGSLAIEAPNASRTLAFLPTWEIFAGFGIMCLLSIIKSSLKRILIALFSLALFINFMYYLHQYFNHTDLETGYDWQDGYKEASHFAISKKSSGSEVFFDKNFEQPYIFYLFYSSYSPQELHSGDRRGKECFNIDYVWFGKCVEYIQKGDYYVTLGSDATIDGMEKIDEVYLKNGKVGVTFFEKVR